MANVNIQMIMLTETGDYDVLYPQTTPAQSGSLSSDGGTLAGNLRLQNASSYGTKINFGSEDDVFLQEDSENNLTIKANRIEFTTINLTKNGKSILSSTLAFTFKQGSAGETFKITGLGEDITGTIPESLKYTLPGVAELNTKFNVKVDSDSKSFEYEIGNYYGVYFYDVDYSGHLDFNTTFNDNTWEQITNASSAGTAASLWNVGDTKTVIMTGNLSNYTFNGKTVGFTIIGINHNASVEGNNRLHILMCKNGAKNSAFCDSMYDSYQSGYCFHMNSTNTNAGGWNGSWMKKTLIADFKKCLPADLKSNLKTVTKYTDNRGSGNGIANNVTATVEDCCLLAEFEVQGVRTYANIAEQNKQLQYDYFKTASNKIFYRFDNQSSACIVWLRSPGEGNTNYFCLVNSDGSASYGLANASDAFAPVLFL